MKPSNTLKNRFFPTLDLAHNQNEELNFDCASNRNGRLMLVANDLSEKELGSVVAAMALSLPNCPGIDLICSRQQQDEINGLLALSDIPENWITPVFAEPESYLHVNAQGYQGYICLVPENNHAGHMRAIDRLTRVMRLGSPVIATRTRDTESLINSSCGYLFDRDDISAMSKAFIDLNDKSDVEIWEMSLESIFAVSGENGREQDVFEPITLANLRKAVA